MSEIETARSTLASQAGGDQVEFVHALTVGRHPHNGLVLGDARVSSRHAVVEWTHTGYNVRDLGSRNGTSLNGKRIRGWSAIKEGDVLRFGGGEGWVAERLVPPPPPMGQQGYLEFIGSGRRVPIDSDRFLIGVGPAADLRVPDWCEGASGRLRAVIYEESDTLWLQPARGIEGVQVDGETWTGGEPLLLSREVEVTLGPTALRVVPALRGDPVVTTAVRRRPGKRYDLSLHLAFEGPDEGTITIERAGELWQCRTGQRFVLLYLLADARGAWVDDRELRVRLWGAARAREMGRNALHKLIYDTRQMLLDAGIDGWFVEKRRGQTRVRLDAARIHITPLP